MEISEMKNQVLSAIDSSDLQNVLPGVCDRMKRRLEATQVSEFDRELLDFLLDFFKNPAVWLDRVATHPLTKTIEEFLETA
jgi:hypothetical protein